MDILPKGNMTVERMPFYLTCKTVTAESICTVNTLNVWWILMNPHRKHTVSFYDAEGNLLKELVGYYSIDKADEYLDLASVITIRHENPYQGGISVSRDGEFWSVSVLPITKPKLKGLTNHTYVNLFNSIKHSYRTDATDKEVTVTTTVFYKPTYQGATVS